MHVAKIEEMKNLLGKLWTEAGLDSELDQIAMLMYLTGMDWYYRLSVWDRESPKSREYLRSCLYCSDEKDIRNLCCIYGGDADVASLCMIACQ